MQSWNVYLDGAYLDTVFFSEDMSAKYVKGTLVTYNGFDKNITVERCELTTAIKRIPEVGAFKLWCKNHQDDQSWSMCYHDGFYVYVGYGSYGHSKSYGDAYSEVSKGPPTRVWD